jgi:hypothetical protein
MKSLLVLAALSLVWAPLALAEEDRLSPEEMAKIDATLVPSPSELFMAVDGMGEFDWDSVVSINPNTNYDSMYLRALNLGSRSAVGFLAIEAKDKKKLGQTITAVLALARAMAVDEMILAKGSELHSLAARKQWNEVRRELDNLKVQVEEYIRDLGDDQNAVLAAAGGWLEGLRAVTKLLSQNYNQQASTVLHQPALIDYFIDRFANMDDKYKSVPVVQEIDSKLPRIKSLLAGERGQPIPKEKVEELNKISTDLVLAIERG